MADNIAFNGGSMEFNGSIEKVTTFASKGGGLTIMIQTGDDPDTAAKLIKNRQKFARFQVSFSETKPGQTKNSEPLPGQESLDLNEED